MHPLIITDVRSSQHPPSLTSQDEVTLSISRSMNERRQLRHRRSLLEGVLLSLARLKEGGIVILNVVSAHCRFTVGILWILSQIFETAQFIRPALSIPYLPDR